MLLDNLEIYFTDDFNNEQRELLIKALIASMRWYALYHDKGELDQEYAVAITDLIDNLVLFKVA